MSSVTPAEHFVWGAWAHKVSERMALIDLLREIEWALEAGNAKEAAALVKRELDIEFPERLKPKTKVVP